MDDQVNLSVGPPETSYQVSRFNALRHGILSKYTVLAWENRADYEILLESLLDEHKPTGPTEEHLVEEIAGVIWRKARLRLAERAAFSRALQRTTVEDQYPTTSKAALLLVAGDFEGLGTGRILTATETEKAAAFAEIQDNETRAINALNILVTNTAEIYSRAIAELSKSQRDEWTDYRESRAMFHDKPEYLIGFINTLFSKYRDRRYELANQPLIRAQAFGEAVGTPALEGLARYEVHLDRKLERMLATLLKLQSLRRDVGIE